MRLEPDDFASLFGVATLPEECKKLIHETDFSYRMADRDKVVLDTLHKTMTDTQIIGAVGRKQVWENGWKENLLEGTAVPKFIRQGLPMRLRGEFVESDNPLFHLMFYRVFLTWIFKTYFGKVNALYEFGCGSGINLQEFKCLYPEKDCMGLDFVSSAVDCVEKIGVKGMLFDMIRPDYGVNIPVNAGVFTSGAIEQLAGRFGEFLAYLMKQKPQIVVNVEPCFELYDDANLMDYLAMMFHKKRGYTMGYLPRLKELEAEKKLEILNVRRLYFGGQMMEGYTLMAWRPL